MNKDPVLVVSQIVLVDMRGKAVIRIGIAAAYREGFIEDGIILAVTKLDVNITLGVKVSPLPYLAVEDKGFAVINEGAVLLHIAPSGDGRTIDPRRVHDGRGIQHIGKVSLGDLYHRYVIVPRLCRVQIIRRGLGCAGIPRLCEGVGVDGNKSIKKGIAVTDDIVISSLTSLINLGVNHIGQRLG